MNKLLRYAFCLVACLLFVPGLVYARDHFIIEYIDPSPEAIITEEEMESWLALSEDFSDAEEELIDAYQAALSQIGGGGEGWLEMNQSDWAKYRQEDAYTMHSPKGGPAYLAFIAAEAQNRTEWLKQLGKKGKVWFIQNYVYQEPGHEGMVIIYRRERGQEMELYTKHLASGAVCAAAGEAETADGKAAYGAVGVEMLELGKSLSLTSLAGPDVCRPGGKFTGTYLLTK
jgi:Protein of unknown function (DUF1311).